MFNPVEVNNFSEDINMNELRDRSAIASRILSRVTLAHLDISSILYIKRIEAQSNNTSWFSQTEQENFQLLYTSPKGGNSPNYNKAYSPSHSSGICVEGEISINNVSNEQHGLGTSSIPYSNSEPANPNLWNSNLNPIFIFGIIKKSADDIKYIIVSLNHMASFINKRNIKNNREINFLYFEGFGQVA